MVRVADFSRVINIMFLPRQSYSLIVRYHEWKRTLVKLNEGFFWITKNFKWLKNQFKAESFFNQYSLIWLLILSFFFRITLLKCGQARNNNIINFSKLNKAILLRTVHKLKMVNWDAAICNFNVEFLWLFPVEIFILWQSFYIGKHLQLQSIY